MALAGSHGERPDRHIEFYYSQSEVSWTLLYFLNTTGHWCCVTDRACQSLSSKWPAAKTPSMSSATCDRGATQAPGHFHSSGRSSLREFPRRSLIAAVATALWAVRQQHDAPQARGYKWQAISVTQHWRLRSSLTAQVTVILRREITSARFCWAASGFYYP
jgi:hypothetical protein